MAGGVELNPVEQAYADTIWQLPEMQLGKDAASQEVETIPNVDEL